MTDYDGTTHMSEETHDAAILGPQAIRHAVTISGIIGLMLTITLCFCINDLNSVLASATGMPAAQIFLDAGGRIGGSAMFSLTILIQFFTGCSAMLADTRMAYAFSRDGALPFSPFFSQINQTTNTPVNAVWLIVVFASALNLIGLGSTATIVAIFNITAPALDLSYAAVILARNIYADEDFLTQKFVPGPYTLGVWQKPLNYIAITWVVFISIVLLFPTQRPITATNMNYAIAVAGFIALFSLGWWWAGARSTYKGPRTKDLLGLERAGTEDSRVGEGQEQGSEDGRDLI